jgi:predicted transcriptional regulator
LPGVVFAMLEVKMNRDKKAIKRDILDKFRSIGVENDTLPPQWLGSDYFDRLDKTEKKLFKQAIKELVSSGLVEQVKQVKGADASLRLTQKGVDLIY